jgi:L-fuculose-phosphate aldolase
MTAMSPDEERARNALVLAGRQMLEKGYIDEASGNLSARLDNGRILVTPSGKSKGRLQPDELLVVDLLGRPDGRDDRRPTSELPMHLEVYRQRPDVWAVVHAHPPFTVALSMVGYSFREALIPEWIVALGPVALVPYATPSSEENQQAIQEVIARFDALVLSHHGTLTAGRSVEEAYARLAALEHGASIIQRALVTGLPLVPIPREQVRKLLDQRKGLGLLRAHEAEFYQ